MTTHLDIKLHYACNNNCIHCVIADQRATVLARGERDFRTTRQIMTEITDARKKGCQVVTLTGGEPTIRRDLGDIVKAARSLGLAVGIQTNGRMLAYPEVRQQLVGHDVRFTIALHGPDADIHDRVTRAPGSFEQTVCGIREMTSANEKVTLKILMSRLNGHCLDRLARIGFEAGAREFNFTFPHGLGNAAREHETAIPAFSEIMPSLHAAMNFLEKQACIYLTESVPLCLLGDRMDHASELAFMTAMKTEVRQLDQPARDWSDDRVKGKTHPPECRGCRLRNTCEGIWTEYFDFHDEAGIQPLS